MRLRRRWGGGGLAALVMACGGAEMSGAPDASVDGRPAPPIDGGAGGADAEVQPDGETLPDGPPDSGFDAGTQLPDGGTAPPSLDPCSRKPGFLGTKYLDLRGQAARRSVVWNNSSNANDAFQLSPYRCVKIKVGQSFEWQWDGQHDLVTFHQMIANGGTAPSFVGSASMSPQKIVAAFPTAGVYGYTCALHPSAMSGVVWVVP